MTDLSRVTAHSAVSGGTPEVGRLRVLMAPDYRSDNPYQSLLAGALAAQGVDVVFPRGYRRVFPLFRVLREQDVGIDVLHLHWLSPYLKGKRFLPYLIYCVKLLVDLSLVRLAGVGIVWTIHNRTSHEAGFPCLEMWLRKRIGASARWCIVHSEAAKKIIRQDLGLDEAKLQVIAHGHYRDAYPPAIDKVAARKALELPLEGLVYLYFGSIRPYKGLETLFQVWRENPALAAAASLLVAGAPFEESYGQHIRDLAAQCRRLFLHLGRIPDDQVAVYFSAADVVVLPFQRSLTSGSLILAMSYGKPVIAPRIDTFVETLGGSSGFLYDPVDEEALQNAMQKYSQEHTSYTANRSPPPAWCHVAALIRIIYLAPRNRKVPAAI